MKKLLVFGSNGWIGKKICSYLETTSSYEIVTANNSYRLDDTVSVRKLLLETNPDIVLNCAGRTRSKEVPSIDFLETKDGQALSVQDNLVAPLNLALLCKQQSIYYVYLATGCIYSYPDLQKPEVYTEEDAPNFVGSTYSFTKNLTDSVMKRVFTDSLTLRIRMPIVADFSTNGILGKVLKYKKVHNYQNSMTVVSDFLPIIDQMMAKRETGIYNLVNEGSISLDEIRTEIYQTFLTDKKREENDLMTEAEMVASTVAPRSNNILSVNKLKSKGYVVPNLKSSVHDLLTAMYLDKLALQD